ncbi:MAG: glutathione peroxidase [Pseudomonadota bacterium]
MKQLLAMVIGMVALAGAVSAGPRAYEFPSIDGGTLTMADWAGQPVLVVNTASRCGFTGQYEGLQALYDAYRDQGLVVFAVPSDDFNQELATAEAVRDFCEINYGLDLPMADITHVRGRKAHPFYKMVRAETGFVPRWNFNKVLIAPDGRIVETWSSNVTPMSRAVTSAVEALLEPPGQG